MASQEGLDSTVLLGLSIVGSHTTLARNDAEVHTPEILESIVNMNSAGNYSNEYFHRVPRPQTFQFSNAYPTGEVEYMFSSSDYQIYKKFYFIYAVPQYYNQ